MMRIPALLTALVACFATSPLAALDFFVNNVAGDNRLTGSSESATSFGGGPVRTIQRALSLCGRGDRIIIANTGVPYYESIGLSAGNHRGYASVPLTIVGNGAILDGSAPVPTSAWEHAFRDVFRFRPAALTNQQLFLDDRPLVRRSFDPPRPGRPALEPLEWTLLDGFIYFRPEENKLPRDYPLTFAARQTGVTLYHVRNVRIENLTVQGFFLDGINAHDGCNAVVLAGVTCRGNGRSGISVGGSSRVHLEGSAVGDNGRVQLRTEGHSITTVHATELIGNTGPAYRVEGGLLAIDGKIVP